MSILPKVPSNIVKDRKWLETELFCVNEIYEKIISDIAISGDTEEFPIPSPMEFIADAESYTTVWETYKAQRLLEYTLKHQATLDYKREQQKQKLDYWSRTPEENERYAIEKAEAIANGEIKEYIIPDCYEEDTRVLSQWMNSEICSYLGMMVELKRIVDHDFPELELVPEIKPIKIDSKELEENLYRHSKKANYMDSLLDQSATDITCPESKII